MNDFRCRNCKRLVHERLFTGVGLTDCEYCTSCLTTRRKQQLVALKGAYIRLGDPDVEYTIRHYLKSDNVFVDIGACVGGFSSLALSICGKQGMVFAFEPMAEFKENLEYLSTHNPEVHFAPFYVALSSSRGQAHIYSPKYAYQSSSFMLNNSGKSQAQRESVLPTADETKYRGDTETLLIETLRFDEFFREKRIDFIKMDVEGHEVEILPTILSYVEHSNYRPHIVFEHVSSNYKDEEIVYLSSLLERFQNFGYEIFLAATHLPITMDLLRSATNITVHCYPTAVANQ